LLRTNYACRDRKGLEHPYSPERPERAPTIRDQVTWSGGVGVFNGTRGHGRCCWCSSPDSHGRLVGLEYSVRPSEVQFCASSSHAQQSCPWHERIAGVPAPAPSSTNVDPARPR
jgi:hypothetical protein